MLKLEGIFKGSFSFKALFYRVEAETEWGGHLLTIAQW